MISQSEAKFHDMIRDLQKTSFIDDSMDESLSASLREHLRGPEGNAGTMGPRGLTGPSVSMN